MLLFKLFVLSNFLIIYYYSNIILHVFNYTYCGWVCSNSLCPFPPAFSSFLIGIHTYKKFRNHCFRTARKRRCGQFPFNSSAFFQIYKGLMKQDRTFSFYLYCTFKSGMYFRPHGKSEGVTQCCPRYNLRSRELLSLSVCIPNVYFPENKNPDGLVCPNPIWNILFGHCFIPSQVRPCSQPVNIWLLLIQKLFSIQIRCGPGNFF